MQKKQTKKDKLIFEKNQKIVSEKRKEFKLTLEPFENLYTKEMINDFYDYWTQVSTYYENPTLKYEHETAWTISSRLKSWYRIELKREVELEYKNNLEKLKNLQPGFGDNSADAVVEIKKNTCDTCKHWKNHQMLLNYWDSTGFCTNPQFEHNTFDGRKIGVIDTNNLKERTKVTGNCSHDVEILKPGSVVPSRYILATSENFGCIFHQIKNKKTR